MMAKLMPYGLTAVVALLSGLWLGYFLYAPGKPITEPIAAEQTQADSSLILARVPDKLAKSKQIVPKGATVNRVVSLTVQPDSGHIALIKPENLTVSPKDTAAIVPRETASAANYRCVCDSVVVDLTLLDYPDGSHRVTASARGGKVIGGVDIPVKAAAPPPRALVWAAGAEYDLNAKRFGGFVDRDLGFARVGGSLTPIGSGVRAGLRFGIRF